MTRQLYDRLRAEVAELRRRIAGATGGGGGTPGAHATSHQNGGTDEISVAGLSGVLADPQTPAAHAVNHEDGGSDPLSVLDLDGYPGGATTFLRDDGTFAATGGGGPHAATHSDGGGDDVSVLDLAGYPGGGTTFLRDDGVFASAGGGGAHATSHEDGGADEIDVTGLSGLLADPQTPLPHGNEAHTETFSTEAYVQEQIAALNVGGAAQSTFLISGGQIVWVEDYDYIVSAASYYINGVLTASPQTPITLDAADPTDDRLDVVAVDDQGDVIVITGTPAAQPAEPDVDPSTQLKLGIVFVAAATTEPGTAETVIVYAENAGDPAEWDWSTSGSGWTLASTTNPRTGTIDIEATAIVTGAYIQGEIGTGTFDPNDYSQLVFYIRSKASWTNNRTMQIRLQNAGAVVGATLSIGNNQFGFNSSNTTDYQQIAIPIAQFAVSSGSVITQVRLTRAGSGSIGFYLDDMSFVGGAVTQPGTGITQEQADARYAPLGPGFVTVAAESSLPNERRLVAGTGISLTDGGAGSTLTVAATGSPGAHATSHQNGGGDEILVTGLSGQLADAQPVGVRKNSTGSTFTRPRLNFIEGANITLTVADDVGDGETDITIEATGTGSPSGSPSGPIDEEYRTRFITVTLGNGTVDITTGQKFVYVTLPAGEITGARLLSPNTGNIEIDVLVGSYAAFPTLASIVGGTPPELSGTDKSEDTTLTGWTPTTTAGDILDVDVLTCSGITRVTLVLTLVQP